MAFDVRCVLEALAKIEQAGKAGSEGLGARLVKNKLGRGQRRLGREAKVILSVPPLTRHRSAKESKMDLSGGTLEAMVLRRPVFRCPLPSLFSTSSVF